MLHIADFGYQLFGKHWLAYELTAVALILNNTFIQGLHTLTGSEILNVLSEHGTCTLVFSIVVMIICFLLTLPRKMENVAVMGIVSASKLRSTESVCIANHECSFHGHCNSSCPNVSLEISIS